MENEYVMHYDVCRKKTLILLSSQGLECHSETEKRPGNSIVSMPRRLDLVCAMETTNHTHILYIATMRGIILTLKKRRAAC